MQNEAGHNEYTYRIVVYLPPFFKKALKNHTEIINAIAGTSIRLDFDVDGFPMPNVPKSLDEYRKLKFLPSHFQLTFF